MFHSVPRDRAKVAPPHILSFPLLVRFSSTFSSNWEIFIICIHYIVSR